MLGLCGVFPKREGGGKGKGERGKGEECSTSLVHGISKLLKLFIADDAIFSPLDAEDLCSERWVEFFDGDGFWGSVF